jgi:hypothetical protein
VVAVAEASLGNSQRCGKIFCRPKIAFLRENLVRRVAPRSSQSSAPIFGCERRAPTSEGCHRWCPVHRDVGRDSREFLEQEKEVGSPASTHLGSVVCFSKRCALLLPRLDANTNYYFFAARANFASSSENALGPRRSLSAPDRESALDSRIPERTILSYHLGKYFRPDVRLLFAQHLSQICPRARVHLPDGMVSWPGELGHVLSLWARASIAPRAG